MARHRERRARDLDRKGVRRSKGPALALAVVLVGVVASVATAALMVFSVQSLGSASSATADKATVVSGQVVVHSGHAVRDGVAVSTLHLYVGSDGRDVDLAGLEVQVQRLQDAQTFRYGDGAMEVRVQRDPDGSVGAPAPVLNRGDLVELVLRLEGGGVSVGSGDRLLVLWQGSGGGTPPLELDIPATGGGTILPLSLR